jgi:hypothetical protein
MELLETTAQSLEIEKIINESNDFTIIVSPYLRINNRLKPKLTDCFSRNNRNLILYREYKLTEEEKRWLDNFKNVKLLSIRNLHAKCYLNERTALITSMNLYEYSQVNNHEIGVKLTMDSNKQEMMQLLRFIKSIVQTDHPDFDFSLYKDTNRVYTIGELYKELAREYTFPEEGRGLDATYVYMCQIAASLHKFSDEDFKFEKPALKRMTILDEKTYILIRKELIRRAVRKS